ncbi:MBL fold metallo-hydrolase [Thalassotalea euphylliae]|uniref:MBL fold metallo-hydrolase n=1 Tax=Thalassotalea euphylliae TaxID=1655234 RepID=A0A3E0TRH9_9GAMM|nr:alkyl sulfatase dimerization domain-containing protein [Thalassotalea euphylliae]REL27108.1 MBL fold metallo-hydrolase [Thalassotalea euphylliae]
MAQISTFKGKQIRQGLQLLLAALLLTGCDSPQTSHDQVSEFTRHHNKAVYKALPFDDKTDFEQAERGLIARDPQLSISDEQGAVLWQIGDYDFVKGDAPDSVNPSLWRQAKLNGMHGLYQVTQGIYQIRGYDIANMSLIKGQTGWIIVDPLTAFESAQAALAMAQKHLGEIKVTGLILTHSHIDHFGGALAVINPELEPNVPVIAPKHFMAEATSENILAGVTMARRAGYMYGRNLAKSATGKVDSGLGKGSVFGRMGVVPPNRLIDQTGQTLTIDGVEFEFQYTPNSEAPAELTFYLPLHKAFAGAELVSRQMHNLYTLRGAKVRDALSWSNHIEDARRLFSDAEIYFGSHHWPIWGNSAIDQFLRGQRDIYKFIHDQTLRLSYKGLTPSEIAETLTLPDTLATSFSNRGYYGTVSHNAKAVYQAYYGWYDGNPANLNPLPPAASAKKYITAMGGEQAVLTLGEAAIANGEYRWAAELLNHLVFANDSESAKLLLAQAYQQLAYQAESAPWRDSYLSAAQELTQGKSTNVISLTMMRDLLEHAPVPRFFDAMAATLNADDAQGEVLSFVFELTDRNEKHVLWLENSVLHHRPYDGQEALEFEVNAQIRISHSLFMDIVLGEASLLDLAGSDELSIEGSTIDLVGFLAMLDKQKEPFNIVEP